MKLDRDGKLAIPETSVEQTIIDLMAAEGWIWLPTKAEAVKRSGAPAHEKYTLDGLFLRPRYPAGSVAGRQLPEDTEAVFCEFKRRRATTKAERLKGQTLTAKDLRERGFLVFQASENSADPIGDFMRWKAENL